MLTDVTKRVSEMFPKFAHFILAAPKYERVYQLAHK